MDEYARTCGECRDIVYSAIHEKIGLCDRLGDCGGDGDWVNLSRTKCLYGNAGKRVPEEEIEKRKEKVRLEHKNFVEHLKGVSKMVESWPKWKRDCGRTIMNTGYY